MPNACGHGRIKLDLTDKELGHSTYTVEIDSSTGMDTCDFTGQCLFYPFSNTLSCTPDSDIIETDTIPELSGMSELCGFVDVANHSITLTSGGVGFCGLRGSMLFTYNLLRR